MHTEYGEYRKLVKGSYTLILQETSDVKRKFSMLFFKFLLYTLSLPEMSVLNVLLIVFFSEIVMVTGLNVVQL